MQQAPALPAASRGVSVGGGDVAFPWLAAQEARTAGVDLRALRMIDLGERGWELHAPIADLPRLHQALEKQIRPMGFAGSASIPSAACAWRKTITAGARS